MTKDKYYFRAKAYANNVNSDKSTDQKISEEMIILMAERLRAERKEREEMSEKPKDAPRKKFKTTTLKGRK